MHYLVRIEIRCRDLALGLDDRHQAIPFPLHSLRIDTIPTDY